MTYSHENTVAAFKDFYKFLVEMWMPPEVMDWPPEEGWPEITEERMAKTGKNATVAKLAKHIPYINHWALLPDENRDIGNLHFVPGADPVDWREWMVRPLDENTYEMMHGREEEGLAGPETLPLVDGGGEDLWRVVLHTEIDAVFADPYYGEAHAAERMRRCPELCLNNSERWLEGSSYEIGEYFEDLKSRFRRFEWIPRPYEDQQESLLVWNYLYDWSDWRDEQGRLRNIFLRNGWPTKHYNKEKCLKEIWMLHDQLEFESRKLDD